MVCLVVVVVEWTTAGITVLVDVVLVVVVPPLEVMVV